ncbi:unnamed protein product, partial [Allacma fusca]
MKNTASSDIVGHGVDRTNYCLGNVLIAVDLLPNLRDSLS